MQKNDDSDYKAVKFKAFYYVDCVCEAGSPNYWLIQGRQRHV